MAYEPTSGWPPWKKRIAETIEEGYKQGVPMTEREKRNEKARNAKEARAERQQKAKERLEKFGLLEIDADTYADSCGTFAGSGRELMKYDYEQKVLTMRSTPDTEGA